MKESLLNEQKIITNYFKFVNKILKNKIIFFRFFSKLMAFLQEIVEKES